MSLDRRASVNDAMARELQLMVEEACQVRGTLRDPATVVRLLAFHARSMRTAIAAGGDAKVLLAPISAAPREKGRRLSRPRSSGGSKLPPRRGRGVLQAVSSAHEVLVFSQALESL